MAIKELKREWSPCQLGYVKHFLLHYESDVQDLPDCCVGSIATVSETDNEYVYTADGWKHSNECGEVESLTAKVAALSEEIENLKEEGGISGGTTTTVSGTLLTLKCEEGNDIVVDGETSETVTLVHCGKNIIPRKADGVTFYSGVTYTTNDDGSVTVKGSAYEDSWPDYIPKASAFHLPAGTYQVTADGLVAGIEFTLLNADQSLIVSLSTNSDSNYSKTFTLTKTELMWAFFTQYNGLSIDSVVTIQLESGEVATDYEPHVSQKISGVSLPTTLNAYNGVNNIYADAGNVITASVRQSVGELIDKAVGRRIAVDWSAYGMPMLYLTGDTTGMTKDDAVDLSYVYGDRSGTASVKWQGSSSLNYAKKNYTINFDNAFEAKEGWGAQKKYCLKANFIDHTHARNLMCASIWGDLVKSAVSSDDRRYSLPNGGAVDGFPCIIMLNGEFHGLYTWNIPKDGWMLGMGSGTQECILCAEGKAQPNADGFKTLETTLGTAFEVEYITDENNTDWALTSLNRMLSAVINSNGSDIDTTVAQYLDWDSVIDHYIQTVLTAAHDCTYKNYLLSTYDGVKWFFTGYDMDSTFGLQWDGKSFVTADTTYPNFASYASVHRAMELIKTHKKDALKARYSALRAGALSEASITNKLTNYTAGIPSQVLDEDARKWPTIPSTSASNLAQMLNWYRLRVAVVDAEINAM